MTLWGLRFLKVTLEKFDRDSTLFLSQDQRFHHLGTGIRARGRRDREPKSGGCPVGADPVAR